jgi:hypothetical protein
MLILQLSGQYSAISNQFSDVSGQVNKIRILPDSTGFEQRSLQTDICVFCVSC